MPDAFARLAVWRPKLLAEPMRDDARAILDGLAITVPGVAIAEKMLSDNVIGLANGSHQGATLRRSGTVLRGIGARPDVESLVRCEADVRLEELRFVAPKTDTYLLRVCDGHTVVVTNCHFRQDAEQASSTIIVEDGGQLAMIGCTFFGGNTSYIIENLAGTNSVKLLGCHNRTTRCYGDVSDLWSF